MHLLGVKPGTNCQVRLSEDKRGFVFDDGGGIGQFVEDQPKLTLPVINTMNGQAYELPTGFPFLLVATGAAPNPWKFVAAPTAGEYLLTSKNGDFELKDVGSLPGVVTPCYNSNLAASGKVLVCTPTGQLDDNGDPIYTVKKLDVDDGRVIVGDTGDVKSLADSDNLEHPKAKIPEFRSRSYQKVDSNGDDVAGGIDVRPNAGDGSAADIFMYDATTKQFFKSPARTKVQYNYSGDVTVTPAGNFVEVGSHMKVANVQTNYPALLLTANMQLVSFQNDGTTPDTDFNIDFALYVDGNEKHVWLVKGNKDMSLTVLVTDMDIGAHTFAIRVKKAAGAGTVKMKNSSFSLTTIL